MMNPETFVSEAVGRCEQSLALDFGGYHITVRTNSTPLLKELRDYYQHFLASSDKTDAAHIVYALQAEVPTINGDWQVKQPDPGKTKIKEHIWSDADHKVVRKVLTGVHLFFIDNRRLCAGPLEDNPNQVVNFVNNMHLEHLLAAGGQLFHASGVCRGNTGLGMAGHSGKGKSTLALRLLTRQFDLVSNDRLVVTRQAKQALTMDGIAKYPRINPGTILHQPQLLDLPAAKDLARYQSLSTDELWDLEEKYDAFVEPAFGVDFTLTANMRAFVILDWDRSLAGPPQLMEQAPRDCPDLVATVMKSPGVMLPHASARIPTARVEDYIELLEHCRLFVLTGGVDFDAAAEAIDRMSESL